MVTMMKILARSSLSPPTLADCTEAASSTLSATKIIFMNIMMIITLLSTMIINDRHLHGQNAFLVDAAVNNNGNDPRFFRLLFPINKVQLVY